jgi:RNA polymerase sigma factor (TIGR02999 family)
MTDVTRILNAMNDGDARAAAELLPAVYDELRRLAAQRLSAERAGQTLQATALVHEAYLRIAGNNEPRWQGRAHFFSAAAEAMRRILIDAARRKQADRHGGGLRRVELDEMTLQVAGKQCGADEILALDEALSKLAIEDPVKAELVKLRFFAGLSIEEAAGHLGISRATATRYFEYARAWLRHEIGDAER